MNLKEFNTTSYPGLYKSITPHKEFGYKYITRFQLNKKRYMKVLGYSKRDDLNQAKAIGLIEIYKQEIEGALSSKNDSKKNTELSVNKDEKKLSKKDVQEFNFLKDLVGDYKNVDFERLQYGIQKVYQSEEMKPYQVELIKLQNYLEKTNKKMIILFEGRDASGKGGAIRRITRFMNARHYRIVALGKPTETQKNQWFFQKYIEHFPTGGEIVLFDRSWYNRAMVEPVFGFCTQKQYDIFMEDVVSFEHDLVRQDIILIKLYFSVSKAEQLARFQSRMEDPLKQWKLSEVDLQAQDLWDEFSEKKYEMLKRTNSHSAPWHIVRSDDKHRARMEALKIILNSVDYDGRNEILDFKADERYNISVPKELARMRKNRDY
jgi:polyphosphate kinase 2